MSKSKEPPRAFKSTIEQGIINTIIATAGRLFRMAKPRFLPDELLELFYEPVYHKLLRDSYREVEPTHQLYMHLGLTLYGSEAYTPLNGRVQFTWNYGDVPSGFFPMTRYGGSVSTPVSWPRAGADPELVEKFSDMVERMLRISYEWGLVQRVFVELNQPNYCATPHQLRYVWPSILPILKRVGSKEANDWVSELQHESTRAGDKARVPFAIQPYMRASYDVVTRAILVLDHQDNVDNTAGGIQYSLVGDPMFSTPGGLTVKGMT